MCCNGLFQVLKHRLLSIPSNPLQDSHYLCYSSVYHQNCWLWFNVFTLYHNPGQNRTIRYGGILAWNASTS